MELLQNCELSRFFEKLSAMSPRSFEEFNRAQGAAAQEFLKPFGAVKAEYTISIPSNLPFPENIPGGGTLFGELSEPAVPVRLQKLFDRGGLIVFTIYFKAGKILSSEENSVVKAVFAWFFRILEDLICANTYKKLVMVDAETGAATVNAFMQFAGMLTATGQSRIYRSRFQYQKLQVNTQVAYLCRRKQLNGAVLPYGNGRACTKRNACPAWRRQFRGAGSRRAPRLFP